MPADCHRARIAGRKYCAGSKKLRESVTSAPRLWAIPAREWVRRERTEQIRCQLEESNSSVTPSRNEKEDSNRVSGKRQIGPNRSHCAQFRATSRSFDIATFQTARLQSSAIRLRKETV